MRPPTGGSLPKKPPLPMHGGFFAFWLLASCAMPGFADAHPICVKRSGPALDSRVR
jgi:hypothetical protein